MSDKINNMMGTTMEKIKQLVDANTVVGTPIEGSGGTIIIPISKITIGFGLGGSDFPIKTAEGFGGGTGGGVTVTPVAFLVSCANGDTRLLQLSESTSTADRLVDLTPDIISKVTSLFSKEKDEPDKASPAAQQEE